MTCILKNRRQVGWVVGFTLSILMFVMAGPISAQTVMRVGAFRSVELHSGGEVILRHGATQRVTLLKGDTGCARVGTHDGGRLLIEKYNGQCHHRYDLQVEIVAPEFAEVVVSDGGRLYSVGSFPRQREMRTAVRNGGSIDVRTIPADRIQASVEQGGRILVMPQTALSASVANGGQISYWGEPTIEKSIHNGGAVSKGSAAAGDGRDSDTSNCVTKPPSTPAVTSGQRRSWIF